MPSHATDMREEPAADELIEKTERRAAGEQVATVRAAVVAERDRLRDLIAHERRAHRHATAEGFADRDEMRLQPQRREVEGITGAAEAALHFIGDEQRARLRARLSDRFAERRRER